MSIKGQGEKASANYVSSKQDIKRCALDSELHTIYDSYI